jgi:hypothetical protein
MRGKLWFLGGLAAGFVLGARAGREKYEELARAARRVKEHPTVQEAAGVVREQANRLYTEGKDMVTDKLSNSRFAETKFGERVINSTNRDAGARAIERNDALDDTLSTAGTTRPNSSSNTSTTPGSSTDI